MRGFIAGNDQGDGPSRLGAQQANPTTPTINAGMALNRCIGTGTSRKTAADAQLTKIHLSTLYIEFILKFESLFVSLI